MVCFTSLMGSNDVFLFGKNLYIWLTAWLKITFIITNSILGHMVNLHSVSLIHQRYNEVECRTKAPEDTSPWVKKYQGGQKPLYEFNY